MKTISFLGNFSFRFVFSIPAGLMIAAMAFPSAAAIQESFFDGVFELANLDGTNGFVINGIDPVDRSGSPVSNAGDVNNDGIDDILIGANNANSGAGESYVLFGGADIGASGAIDLDTLDGTDGFALYGENPRIQGVFTGDRSGWSVSDAGDVNSDGIDDLIIGAPFANTLSETGQRIGGLSYVVFGSTSIGAGGSLQLSDLDGTNGVSVYGNNTSESIGRVVSSAGDLNGDGFDDFVITDDFAAPDGKSLAGKSFVVFGGADFGASSTMTLGDLNGANGFVINGIDPQDRSGVSVSSAGDVDGDGTDDLIIGTFVGQGMGGSTGESYVVFGGTDIGASGSFELSDLNGANGFVLNGIDADDVSGIYVDSAGDLNADEIDDLIIGAIKADPEGIAEAGESYVVFGGQGLGAGGTVELSDLDGTNGFVMQGIDPLDFSGYSVTSAGDVNGDGIDDVIVGAPIANDPDQGTFTSTGESYVIFGGTDVGASGVIKLGMLDGSNGFVLKGIDPGDNTGFSLSSAGDVNDDGIDDLIIGAYGASPGGTDKAGRTYVVFGQRNIPEPSSFALVSAGLFVVCHRRRQ